MVNSNHEEEGRDFLQIKTDIRYSGRTSEL